MEKATLESQILDEVCMTGYSEEEFYLKEMDDYQSHVKLGNILSRQYRFKEAIKAYREAGRIDSDDYMLHIRLGGAYLTIRRFEDAYHEYMESIRLSGNSKVAAFPLGIWHFLGKDYKSASECFFNALPCDDETRLALIYWNHIASRRGGFEDRMIDYPIEELNPGHHDAYLKAILFFRGDWDESRLHSHALEHGPLEMAISLYAIYTSLDGASSKEKDGIKDEMLSGCRDVWPSIPYLALWNDVYGTPERKDNT